MAAYSLSHNTAEEMSILVHPLAQKNMTRTRSVQCSPFRNRFSLTLRMTPRSILVFIINFSPSFHFHLICLVSRFAFAPVLRSSCSMSMSLDFFCGSNISPTSRLHKLFPYAIFHPDSFALHSITRHATLPIYPSEEQHTVY